MLENKEASATEIRARSGTFLKTTVLELEKGSMQGETEEAESMELYYLLWWLSFVNTN